MKLGYDITIEQTQKLVMTPELIQAIQILQYNTQELDLHVQEQLNANPLLEQESSTEASRENEGDLGNSQDVRDDIGDFSRESSNEIAKENSRETKEDWEEYINQRQYDDISYTQGNYVNNDENDYNFEQFTIPEVTLVEHLIAQFQFADLKKNCEIIGKFIIESLDENGYMTLTVEEIARAMDVPLGKVKMTLETIQGFEPSGVGARDLKECLCIQLDNKGLLDEVSEKLIDKHLEDLAGNKLSVIAKDLAVTVKEIQNLCDVIRTLEPKPGRQFSSQASTKYIVPDVIVEKIDGEYVVTVNESGNSRLMISSYYRKVLNESENDEQIQKFLSGRLNSAMWLIKSIEQRRQTIFNVVTAIVKYQKDFFDFGPRHLKPMNLKQMAEEVGVHESTVSRAIHGKYMQCPKGLFELKYFFASGVSDELGKGFSSESVKSFIKEMVGNEDVKSPLSDQDMVEILKGKGIEISRRTVAKYRDELNILSSSKRKRF